MTRHLLLAAIPALVLAAVLVPQNAPAAPVEVDKAVLEAQAQRIAAIKKVLPAVVAVCKHGEPALNEGPVVPMGSGVIISADGYALTNFHVTDACSYRTRPQDGKLLAGLADGVLYDALLCGIDKIGDVALIKLQPKAKDKPFPFVTFGDSDKVRAGDWSLAMGNPFSLAMEYTDCIQIETSINPGNSGGPLFNMQGELIGINGRGSFEKRGRVNSGVGYAISINQIKNFMGHLKAGIDTDHATLGATVASAGDDGPLPPMLVKQILEESDAFRRGLKEGDQLIEFAGRPVTSSNQYKNVLGIYPKDWRIPLTVRRANTRQEYLVRLMGNMATVKPNQPMPGGAPAPAPPPPPPKGDPDPSKPYQARKGYSNWYFNLLERDKLLAAAKKHGDYTTVPGKWVIDGTFDMVDRNGPMKIEIVENKDTAKVSMKLNVATTLEPLVQTGVAEQQEPIGSGGLMMAMYHYHRFLTLGAKGFEGLFAHGGNEPFYPPPANGAAPKSLASLRVDCAVIITKHGSVVCKWYFSHKDATLLGFETYIDKNADATEDRDPCEVYFYDYKDVDGKKLPHRMEVRYRDKRYAVLTVSKFTLEK